MPSPEQQHACVARLLDGLRQQQVPDPDEIMYQPSCIQLLWHEAKACLQIDLDDNAG